MVCRAAANRLPIRVQSRSARLSERTIETLAVSTTRWVTQEAVDRGVGHSSGMGSTKAGGMQDPSLLVLATVRVTPRSYR